MNSRAMAASAERPRENRRINRSSFVVGIVSGGVASLLGIDPMASVAFGALVGAGAWSWGMAKQALRG